MSHSSLGLTIGIPPNVAETLRQQPSSTTTGPLPPLTDADGATNIDSLLMLSSSSPPIDTAKEELLPGIVIQIEKLIGYQPTDSDELRAIQHQLVQAMWTRYQQTTSDGNIPPPISHMMDPHHQPPPDFDRQVMEFFDSGVARYMEPPLVQREGTLILEYPPFLQNPVTGEQISTVTIMNHIQQKQPLPLEFIAKLWTYLRHCSRPLLWKQDMASELSLLLREEQARLEYQEWTESKRQAKLDHLYSVRETLVHQVEMTKTKVEILEEQRDIQVDEAMEPLRRKIQQKTSSLETFGSTELSFPDEFQWLGLKDDTMLDDEDDWGQGYDSDGEYSYESKESNDIAGDDESSAHVVDDCLDGDFVAAGYDDTEKDLGVRNDVDISLCIESKPIDSPVKPLMENTKDRATVSLTTVATEENPDITSSGEAVPTKHSLTAAFQRRKKKREKAKRRKKEEEKAKEQRVKQQELQRLEEEMRIKLTSNELILAQTMRNALAQKLEKIEELLDSLQDEVWQAEEEAEQQCPDDATGRGVENGEQFSLLDQVLAMILGATPMSDRKSPAEHFQFMQSEHQSIVQAWKAHFGRLPPPATNSKNNSEKEVSERPLSSKEYRQLLGITENECDDWDAVENWDSILDETKDNDASKDMSPVPSVPSPSTNASQKPYDKSPSKVETTPPKLVGLRPGGRAIRLKQDEQ